MAFGLMFVDEVPVQASDPNRADIACFVGFVNQREGALSGELARWLVERGWASPPHDPPVEAIARDPLPSSLTLSEATNRLVLTLDGLAQTMVLPLTPLAPEEIVAAINRALMGGYAYLDVERRLVIGTDARGQQASVQVRRHLPLGYAVDAVVLGSALRRTPIPDLVNVPVPIDTWEVFDHLYAWDQRQFDEEGSVGITYLGAAVRSFFALGGRKCYVVRAGDAPLARPTMGQAREERMQSLLQQLIPGYPYRVNGDPMDPATWRGITHLFGLGDVSFVCLPDLADAVSVPPADDPPPPPSPTPDERFVECSDPVSSEQDTHVVALTAPRCDDAGYDAWARAVHLVGDMIARYQREVQLVAGVPLPERGHAVQQNPLAALVDSGRGPLGANLNQRATAIASPFVQLVYPWVRTPGSAGLPERAEPPEAVVIGLLAQNALTRGGYRSAGLLSLGDVYELVPDLSRDQVMQPVPDNPSQSGSAHTLAERVSLLGPTPDGLRLLSDVTTSLDESYRLASVNRLVSIIVRASRLLGQTLIFEPSSPALWRQLRDQMENLLRGLWKQGALRGASPADAFSVRCDRSTMSQQDIDRGRLIAEVTFTAAVSIERITVILALEEAGQVSLVGANHG